MKSERVHGQKRARIRLQWRALEFLRDRTGKPIPACLAALDDPATCAAVIVSLSDRCHERTAFRILADLRAIREAVRPFED